MGPEQKPLYRAAFGVARRYLFGAVTMLDSPYCLNRALSVGLVGAMLLWATPSGADPLALNMELLPSTSSVNRLNITVSASILSDSELTRLSGNILTMLDYDIVNGLPRFNTIQFTGGTLNINGATTNNVLLTLNGGLLGRVDVTGTAIGGTLETPAPPSLVTSGEFATEDHQIRLNQGVLSAIGTGIFSEINETIDLTAPANQIALTQEGIGTIDVQQIAVNGLNRTFQATLVLPVDAEETLPELEPETTVIAVGSVTAQAEFVIAFPLEGDYNGDGIVNAADYVLWRDSNGKSGLGLSADGNFDLVVDDEDYEVGMSNFGATPPSSAAGAVAIPEPASLLLSLASLTPTFFFRWSKSRQTRSIA